MSASGAPYGSAPGPSDSHMGRGYGTHPGTGISDFAQGNPSAATVSPLSQQGQYPYPAGSYSEDYDGSQTDTSAVQDGTAGINRSASTATTAVPAAAPSRSNTLRKKSSMKRVGSLKRSASRKSMTAGSIKSTSRGMGSDEDFNSIFHTPVPTQGSPTEVLANRFQAWRQLLKSLIAYFREIQDSYDSRAKAVKKVQSTISSIVNPSVFMSEHGLGEATRMLDDYHKRTIAEANKSREIENDVIGALTGLRSDLGQKIKEIKSLSGDFKSSVDKEKEGTRREVEKLQEALQHADHEDGSATGKNDPFVVKLGVDRMVERQIDEENYLHRAYLNLESSGRELESIVVGEIQKAYNALAGILKREADDAHHVVEGLRSGPIAMPKDQDWMHFVVNDPHFVDPELPLRRIEDIQYPGKNHPAATEVRAGMLERKSKYLKSYTPGWYVLSPTHLHEFKSADKIYTQPPVMSLYLLDQRLGSKSEVGSSSNKFMLKGKQSGGVHKGHNWVFRAETHDTMMAWYEDIRVLTESTGEARTAFVRKHARSISGTSDGATVSDEGFEDDEADAAPYRADVASLAEVHPQESRPQRPAPGGRFPSNTNVPRTRALTPSSGSEETDRDVLAAGGSGLLAGSAAEAYDRTGQNPYKLDGVSAGNRTIPDYQPGPATVEGRQYYDDDEPVYPSQAAEVIHAPTQTQTYSLPVQPNQPVNQQQPAVAATLPPSTYDPTSQTSGLYTQQPQQTTFSPAQQRPFLGNTPDRYNSMYGDWMAPTAAGVAGVGAGVAGGEYLRNQRETNAAREQEQAYAPTTLQEETRSPMVNDMGVMAEGIPNRPGSNDNLAALTAPSAAPAETSMPLQQSEVVPPVRSAPAPVITSLAAARVIAPTPLRQSEVPEPVDNLPATVTSSEGREGRTGLDGGEMGGSGLGGLEAKGAHETGRFAPIVRHDTDMSISALHIPGEYPKKV
ncbi:phosphatidylinositol 4,5-bisphosphate-binding protein [Recurvomyces mirabilis]|nr:phosphatidylinositol 4,5-bisphosphate-binding protein [Recurvomyces mirabilis]